MQENRSQQEPQLLRQLREKALAHKFRIQKAQIQKKQSQKIFNSLQNQYNRLLQEKQVQLRKNKSFIVLLHQLQQMYYQNYLEGKINYGTQKTQNDRMLENSFLRHLLIKQTQNNKQLSKVLSFLKQLQTASVKNRQNSKDQSFIKRSNFIENQSEILAKLHSQLSSFRNENLQCTRKWYQLQEEKRKLQNEQKLYKVQVQRQKAEIKEQYQIYLDRMNEAKMKLVTFNETQRQNTITEYFVKEIAILQQKRTQIQEENHNLKSHYENLKGQLSRIQIQNKQLNGFFGQQNNNSNQQNILASKMKKRIEELRDILIEERKKNKDTRNIKLNKITENLRNQYQALMQANHFMEMRIRQQEDYGASLDQKPVADFFTGILQKKDKELIILREREGSLKDQHKQLQVKKQLLENQINNLEDNVKMSDYQTHYNENSQWRHTTNTHVSASTQQQQWKSSNPDWKQVAKETNKALGMQTYFEGSFR